MSAGAGLASRRPARERAGAGDRALLAVGAAVAAVAAIAYLAALATHPYGALLKGFDLSVYLGGAGQAARDPGHLYTWTYEGHPGIQFTYTPFAALLFRLGRALPFRLLMDLVALASTFALAATIWIAFRELGWRPVARAGATLLLTGLMFWTEPVQRGLYLGQVELVLMGLIVWDLCQPGRRWWKGAATGLAAGIKLVPLLLIVYLAVTRQFRQAAVSLAAFAATVAIGFAALPHPSVTWWIDGDFFQAGRTGFVGDQQNQSLRGIITRLAGSVAGAAAPWLVAAVLAAVLGLAAAAVLHNSGRTFAGLMACYLTALLVSPISWDHHWVWIAPGLALIIDAAVRAGRGRGVLGRGVLGRGRGVLGRGVLGRGRAVLGRGAVGSARAWWYGLAGAVLVVYGAWPDFWSPAAGLLHGGLINYAPASSFAHGDNPAYVEYHWQGLQLLAGNLYILAGIGLFIVACVTAFRQARAHGGAARLLRLRA